MVRTENAPAEIADKAAALNKVNLREVDSETIDRSGMTDYAIRMTVRRKAAGVRARWPNGLWMPCE